MKTLKFLAASALALAAPVALAPAAMAQTAAAVPAIAPGHTLLTVNAQGSSTSTPDMAGFSAGVTTQAATGSEALKANSTRMSSVVAALKKAGVADRDIQTSNLNVSPIYAQPVRRPDGSYDNQERRITGYEATNTVSVKLRKLEQMGKVVDALVDAGANQINGPQFMMADPDEVQDEARTDAIAMARHRADLYAKAAGLRVVGILSISEGGYVSSPSPVMYRMRAEAAPPAPPPPPPVAAGELETTASVVVQFELAP